MERTHQTSTVVSTNFSNGRTKPGTYPGVKPSVCLSLLVCCLMVMSTTGCGKPLAYHIKHYHRPFAAIAKSNQTYFHSSQTGKIIEKDPCASYCEPGCYGYEPTTWTHWPMQCPGKFPVQGEVFEEPVGEYGDAAYYDGGMGAPVVVMDSMSSVPAPAPVVSSTRPNIDDALDFPAAPGNSRVGSGVPSVLDKKPKAAPPSAIPTDIESATPSPSDATAIPKPELPFVNTNTANVSLPMKKLTAPSISKAPTSRTPILSAPIAAPPTSTPATTSPVPTTPNTNSPLKLRSVRTTPIADLKIVKNKKIIDKPKPRESLAARLKRTPPIETNDTAKDAKNDAKAVEARRLTSADSLKKIRIASGQSDTVASKSRVRSGPSLSQKLFTVREVDKAKKVTLKKAPIKTQPLRKITSSKKPKVDHGVPFAKKVVPPTKSRKAAGKPVAAKPVSKVAPWGLPLAKKVRPKSAPKVSPNQVAAPKVAPSKTAKAKPKVDKVATSKPTSAKVGMKPTPKVTLPQQKIAAKAKPSVATKKPVSAKPAAVATKKVTPAKLASKPLAKSKGTLPKKPTAKVAAKQPATKKATPRLTPMQMKTASRTKVKLKEVSQPIVVPRMTPLSKMNMASKAKSQGSKKATVVMKANAGRKDSVLQFAKDPPRRELRVTTLPESVPSVRFK